MDNAVEKSHNSLREVRTQQGLTLRELAHFCGVSHTTVRRLERGEADVAAVVKARLARVLRVPLAELWPADEAGP